MIKKKLIAFFCAGLFFAFCSVSLVSVFLSPSNAAAPQNAHFGKPANSQMVHPDDDRHHLVQLPDETSWQIMGTPSTQELYVPRNVQIAYDKETRSLDGKPGKKYWQNKSEFKISIDVAPPDRRVSATEEITYFNNSPDSLNKIAFRLYLNAHNPGAIREKPKTEEFLTSGANIDEFRVNGEKKDWEGQAENTIHVINLDQPLAPNDSITFSFKWHYDLAPEHGWKEGVIDDTTYHLAYFYPRVTVYDDTSGWDLVPFTLGREFHNDFSDYTFEVNVPKNFVVWATGDLLNPDEVLQPIYAQRLQESLISDQVINIAQPEEIGKGKVTAQTDKVTWKWQADYVPDVAITVSNHYIWDAGSVVVDPATNRRSSVQAAYNREATDFKQMVEYGKHALAWASTEYPGVPYPFSKTTIIRGDADEEYPMMANDSSNVASSDKSALEGLASQFPGLTRLIVSHELLHSWFPFYMGINETRYPSMDEGWTTAFEHLIAKKDMGDKKAIKLFQVLRVVGTGWSLPFSGNELPVITPHDSLFGQNLVFGFNPYGKAALGYLALKELMGDQAFKHALHVFIDRWNGKHPLPWDMFNTFNDVSTDNYNWFFKNWFFSYNYMDLKVESVEQTNDGYAIQIQNVGGMAMPFDINIFYADGSKDTFRQNPGIWKASLQRAKVTINTSQPLQSLSLDGGIFVDFNSTDNNWDNT